MSDWIKLHRSIIDSKQFANPIQLKIWIWLLCKAVYSNRNISLKIGKGYVTIQLKRGQLIFGRSKAEEALCIDGSSIYRQLQAMEADKAITIESNNQYSIITILKYNDFQSVVDDDFIELEDKPTPNEQPMNNQRTTYEQQANNSRAANEQQVDNSWTHNKKDNNLNNENKEEELKEDIPPPILIFDSPNKNESPPIKPPNPPLPVKPQKKPKPTSCLFEESEYFDLQKFEAEFVGSKYEGYNLEFYYEKVLNWSRSGGQKKVDWIATARNFMLGDYEKGKAVLKPQNILYGQQQSNTNRHTGGKPSLDNIRNELASKYGQNGGQG